MNVNRPATIKIGEHTMSNSYCEKLHGVKIDKSILTIILKRLLKKPVRIYIFLARLVPCMCISKRKLLINAFLGLNLATVHLYGCDMYDV